ncbi:4'-phosphopantetheinyl transferase family protein [Sphaerimonospora cavernae]|uniref:4'-phosphopantetheinyl transferase family protein n=1 Tax=Sphaerimonospora cavernae TaxID=1740611 RepID=A0ABV6UC19_9ACTN
MIPVIQRTGECRVWWADPRHQPIEAMMSVLNGPELRRASRFHREQDRRRFLTGAWLLRMVAGAELGVSPERVEVDRWCSGCGKAHGKPHIRTGEEPLHVSVSHSGNRVVVAVTTVGPLGVDVEAVPSGPVDALARCALSPAELPALRAVPESERRAAFARLWVRKEAVLKATGHGLRVPPDHVEVSGPDERPALVRWPLDIAPEDVPIAAIDAGAGYAGAIAVLARDHLITVSESHSTDLVQVPIASAASAA